MGRENALEAFLKESQEMITEFNKKFWEDLFDAKEQILVTWKDGIKNLKTDQRLEDKVCTYIYSFMLRYDILNENYNVYLYVLDDRYIFDPDAVKAVIKLDFLFTEISRLKTNLLKNSWKYRGKVNSYDIDHLILEKVMDCNWKICFLLRFMLREDGESEEIGKILKANKQIIRWGEYRDRGETIFSSIRNCLKEDTLKSLLKKNEKYFYILQNSYHINEICKDFNCIKRDMQFSRFICCNFENIRFDQSDLTGTYFKDCNFNSCSFNAAILDLVTFENCRLQKISWDASEFWGTFCNHTELGEQIEEQKQNILQKKEDFDESVFLYGAGYRNRGLH